MRSLTRPPHPPFLLLCLTFFTLLAAGALGTPALAQECTSDPECDDGQVCNGAEYCDIPMGGFCMPGTPIVCDDSDPCTEDSCIEPSGTCQYDLTPDAEAAAGPDGLCDTSDDNLALFGPDGICGNGDDAVGDGVCALQDNCPDAYNPGQEDRDWDGTGDACDPTPALRRGLYGLTYNSLARIDPDTPGALYSPGSFPGARDVAVNADETLVAVAGYSPGSVYFYDLASKEILYTESFGEAWGVDFGPLSGWAYVVDRGAGMLVGIDPSGGIVFMSPAPLGDPMGLAVNASETIAYVTQYGLGEVSAVDLQTGMVNPIATLPNGPVALELSPAEDALYVLESSTDTLSRVDLPGGAVTPITSALVNPQGITLDAAGISAYVTESSGGFPTLATVNLITGDVTPIFSMDPPELYYEFTFGLDLSPRPPVVLSLPDDAAGAPGESIVVPISVTDLTGLDVISADVTLAFNPAVLTATAVNTGSLTPDCTVTSNLGTAGAIAISVVCTTARASIGDIATVSMDVVGVRGSGTPLHIESALLNEGTPAVSPDDGRFTVPVTISGGILYYRDEATSTEPSTKPVDGTYVTLERFDPMAGLFDPVAAVFTDCTSEYLFPIVTPIESYLIRPEKDDDFQSAVDPYDAALNAQHVVGLITLTPYQRFAADASGNGTLTSFDSARIAQFSVGLIPRLPVAVLNDTDWVFVPVPQGEPNQIVYSPWPPSQSPGQIFFNPFIIEPAENQDFLGILFGDVSGNWQSACAPLALESAAALETKSLSPEAGGRPGAAPGAPGALILPTLKAAPGETIQVPIRAEGAAGAIAFYLDLRYDPDVLQPVSASQGPTTAGLSLSSNLGEKGRGRLALYGATPVEGDGDIAVVTFRVVGRAGSRTSLTMPAFTANEGRIRMRVKPGSVTVTRTRSVR